MERRSRIRLKVAGQPLAHSAPAGRAPDLYRDHVAGTAEREGVVRGAARRAEAMLVFASDPATRAPLREAVVDAATFHDLGKLDDTFQAALRVGPDAKVTSDHVDAGVAHLMACGAEAAAWLVRAHHAPGLPSAPHHFTRPSDPRLRGVRRDDAAPARHREQIDRTDRDLPALLAAHAAAIGPHAPHPGPALHGLPLRLALSCLVDADHADTAAYDAGWAEPIAAAPRWEERLARLDRHVAGLGGGLGGARDDLRRAFYAACRDAGPDEALVACDGPVGIGKTTAVTAFLLRRAIATGARRLVVVAPYTAVLAQSAEVLRRALVLDGENPFAVVAEHHHRADFEGRGSRDLAVLWTAPVILTTAVQFFETLAAAAPAALRKLHALPGSVLFLDEAHGALPTRLWPQNWRWLRTLAEEWGCSLVLASGSLARAWELDDLVGADRKSLPDLGSPGLRARMSEAEASRVRFVPQGRFTGPDALAAAVASAPGPRLLIMNTVQSAAVMASRMRRAGHHVLHLSTALAPRDRDRVLARIRRRLDFKGFTDWTLVATSLMEAGIDVSFRTAFRERFSLASLIQVGGRVNRGGEWPDGGIVHDVSVENVDGLVEHPGARIAAGVLADLFDRGRLDGAFDAARLATDALRLEAKRGERDLGVALQRAESDRDYPGVVDHGRVIDADTRLVVVDPELKRKVEAHEAEGWTELQRGSVQLWATKIASLAVEPLAGRPGLFGWPYAYDPDFLGYMEGAIALDAIRRGEALIL